jgi:hypothetical protein
MSLEDIVGTYPIRDRTGCVPDEVDCGLEVKTLLLHDDADHVVGIATRLLDVVGEYVL